MMRLTVEATGGGFGTRRLSLLVFLDMAAVPGMGGSSFSLGLGLIAAFSLRLMGFDQNNIRCLGKLHNLSLYILGAILR